MALPFTGRTYDRGIAVRSFSSTARATDEVQCRDPLDIVLVEGAMPFRRLAVEEQVLLLDGHAVPVPDLSLHDADGVRGPDAEGEYFPGIVLANICMSSRLPAMTSG